MGFGHPDRRNSSRFRFLQPYPAFFYELQKEMASDPVRFAKMKLMELKPAPDVEGLLEFFEDVPRMYSSDEQRCLSESATGKRLGQAIVTCERIKPSKVPSKRNPEHGESELATKRKLALYQECLSRAVCENRWKHYSRCWATTVSGLTVDEIRSLHKEKGLRNLCSAERKSLERCVGHAVVTAVQTSDARSNEKST